MISSLRLAKAAIQAEILRLKVLLQRQARRAVFAVIALVFALFALAGLHIIAGVLLARVVSPLLALVIVVAADVVVAGILLVLASRSRPGQAEQEARAVRDEAWRGVARQMAVFGTLTAATRRIRRRR